MNVGMGSEPYTVSFLGIHKSDFQYSVVLRWWKKEENKLYFQLRGHFACAANNFYKTFRSMSKKAVQKKDKTTKKLPQMYSAYSIRRILHLVWLLYNTFSFASAL